MCMIMVYIINVFTHLTGGLERNQLQQPQWLTGEGLGVSVSLSSISDLVQWSFQAT